MEYSIDKISDEEYSKLWEKYVNKENLSKQDLTEIEGLFSEDGKKVLGEVRCDEYHSHSDKCLVFKSKGQFIVHRLVREILRDKVAMEEARNSLRERLE